MIAQIFVSIAFVTAIVILLILNKRLAKDNEQLKARHDLDVFEIVSYRQTISSLKNKIGDLEQRLSKVTVPFPVYKTATMDSASESLRYAHEYWNQYQLRCQIGDKVYEITHRYLSDLPDHVKETVQRKFVRDIFPELVKHGFIAEINTPRRTS